jgi:hypothetical protein
MTPTINDLYSNIHSFLNQNMMYGTTVEFGAKTKISGGVAWIEQIPQYVPDYTSAKGIYKITSSFDSKGFNVVTCDVVLQQAEDPSFYEYVLGQKEPKKTYLLPYKTDEIIWMRLVEQADIFFTATLTGCTIFIEGDPTSPWIYHANAENEPDKPIYMKKLFDKAHALSLPGTEPINLKIFDKEQYKDPDHPEIFGAGVNFVNFCGTRFGGEWSFYWQGCHVNDSTGEWSIYNSAKVWPT